MAKKQFLQLVAIPVVATLVAWAGVNRWLHVTSVEDDGSGRGQAKAVETHDVTGPPAWAAPGAPVPKDGPGSQPFAFKTVETSVARGSSLSQTLKDLGLFAPDRAALMTSLSRRRDPARVPAGTKLKAVYAGAEDQSPSVVEVRLDKVRSVVLTRQAKGDWDSALHETPVERRIAAYSGRVTSSLWNSATAAGMDPRLISRLSEIFAWVVDFNRDVHTDDRWRLTIERLFVGGQPAGYGDILAAQFDSSGTVYGAVHYEGPDAPTGFYTPEGGSLRRLFLRCPLAYGHITSGFSAQRFHPILKVNKPHLGVDYGAPAGTPVMVVGDGTVNFAAHNGGSGNMISVRHGALYETQYKHLSAFAKGIKPGATVTMGQVIGYVGATGLATGPHLHFEFHVGSAVVDPLGLHFPAADPVPAPSLAHFRQVAAAAIGELPPWSVGSLTQNQPRSSQIPME